MDDNRIVAAHAEAHYILGALAGKHRIWWKHPETQRFWCTPNYVWLAQEHERLVAEMEFRGYGHRTPLENDYIFSEEALSTRWREPQADCFGVWWNWFDQDLADLYRKWGAEFRYDESHRWLRLGRITKKGYIEPRRMHFDNMSPVMILDMAREAAEKLPHREWTLADRRRLSPIVDAREPHHHLRRDNGTR